MAGVGRRGFAAAARAAMFAQNMQGGGGEQHMGLFKPPAAPAELASPAGMDGRRANAPKWLDIGRVEPDGTSLLWSRSRKPDCLLFTSSHGDSPRLTFLSINENLVLLIIHLYINSKGPSRPLFFAQLPLPLVPHTPPQRPCSLPALPLTPVQHDTHKSRPRPPP